MKYVHVLVEGQTEETFVRDVINPYLEDRDVFLIAKIVTTKYVKIGKDFKGGISKYNKIRNDIQRLLGDSSISAVTTMIDYYGLPNDFPGKGPLQKMDCYSKVHFLESQFLNDISNRKFIPFLVLHEFETYLFTSPENVANVFPKDKIKDKLVQINNQFTTPEEIDEGKDTHPAARIKDLIPGYRKTLHGPLITKRIGLDDIRRKCNHFDKWLIKLESL